MSEHKVPPGGSDGSTFNVSAVAYAVASGLGVDERGRFSFATPSLT